MKIRIGKKNGQEVLERDESPDQAYFRSKLKLRPYIKPAIKLNRYENTVMISIQGNPIWAQSGCWPFRQGEEDKMKTEDYRRKRT